MPWPILLLILVALWLGVMSLFWVVVYPRLMDGPRADPVIGFWWHVARAVAQLRHGVRVEGAEELRDTQFPDGLIVVSNHTGAVDPLLIQSACRFHIRWMMASSMMGRSLDWVWRMLHIIPIARDGRDSGPAREAIRYVRAGGVLGIFPEGRIVVPPCEIRPFQSGVGLIIARSKAPVLLVWVSGTPNTNKMAASVLGSSRARVRFQEHVEFPPKADATTITNTIREALAEMSGWPLNDEPMPPLPDNGNGNGDPFAS